MTAFTGELACARCGAAPEEAFAGCPACRSEGVPANVHPIYDPSRGTDLDPAAPGLFRYRRMLPIPDGAVPVSLGEGNTPLVAMGRLGEEFGLDRLFLKDETRNPTWSYKDRLAAVAVTAAVAAGADTIVVGTTGNHGAAAAAYAAAAGLRCVAVTLASVPETMKVLMQVLGADVVAVPEPADRWTLMRRAVAERGWVPLSGLADPPVGSNPYGIDGYKTVAYELVEELGRAPDVVLVPVAYGDGLIGIHRGFVDLFEGGSIDGLPRMVAVEPFGPYAASLADGGDIPVGVEGGTSVAFSIASPLATYQGVRALRESGGTAVVVSDDAEILKAQRRLAGSEGFYLEASAAIALPALQQMCDAGGLGRDETVVILGTSSGLKDVGTTAASLPEVPVIPPTLDALDSAIR